MLRALALPLLLSVFLTGQASIKNGFDLSKSLIDPAQVHSGGPPRDDIPSLDGPTFVHAEQAGFLASGDRVIGVHRNGLAKAYPIRILNWHEVVNDDFDGAATLVTYTAVPLMRTAVRMLSEAVVDRASICAAVDQAGDAGTDSFAAI